MKRASDGPTSNAKRMVNPGSIAQGNAPILSSDFNFTQSSLLTPVTGVPLLTPVAQIPVNLAQPPTLGISQYPPPANPTQFPPPGFSSAPPGFGSAPPGFEASQPQAAPKKKKKKKKKKRKNADSDSNKNQSHNSNQPVSLPQGLVPLDVGQSMFVNQMMGSSIMIPLGNQKILSAVPAQSAPLSKRRKRITKLKPKASDPIHLRYCAGETWVDRTLTEWPENDFRIFCGDLGNEVSDAMLTAAFSKYPSFAKAKVIRDKRNGKSRGFGFVSFLDPQDFLRALKEMNGKYVGNRPVKLKKSNWKSRTKAIKNFKPGMRPNQPTKRYDLPGPV